MIVTLVLAVAALAYTPFAPVSVPGEIELEVAAGTPTRVVSRQLEDAGVIRNATALELLARVTRLDREVRFGKHVFSGRMSAVDVLVELTTPPRDTVRVTIPEGLSWREAAAIFEAAGVFSAADYQEAVCDPGLIRLAGAGPEANCTEGYLFPDTYELTPGMSALEVANMQVRQFREVIEELSPAEGLELSEREIVTLASVIEKETSKPEEREIISAVFHNRLRRGMKLQADPTVIYGLPLSGQEWTGNLQRKHLRADIPYNTYVRRGLPPGPICNPGRGALAAAMNPADSKYLYFVARKDGSHRFSNTLAEHNKAVREHQLRR